MSSNAYEFAAGVPLRSFLWEATFKPLEYSEYRPWSSNSTSTTSPVKVPPVERYASFIEERDRWLADLKLEGLVGFQVLLHMGGMVRQHQHHLASICIWRSWHTRLLIMHLQPPLPALKWHPHDESCTSLSVAARLLPPPKPAYCRRNAQAVAYTIMLAYTVFHSAFLLL